MASTQGQQISTENAREVLLWIPEYRIIVCCEHGYAIRDVRHHLRHFHKTSQNDRLAVSELFSSCSILAPMEVSLPPSGVKPFDCLKEPRRGFVCSESGCDKITINRDEIRKHCNTKHSWRATKKIREHWGHVWVQTFFTAGNQRYFTVDYSEAEADVAGVSEGQENQARESPACTNHTGEVTVLSAIDEWKQRLQQHEEELQVAEAETAKTDHTLWFKRNQWPEHLKGRNLRHLSRAARLPDRDEELLQKAVEVSHALIERCVAGLSTLDLEVRRWLRGAKHSEPDQRPFARLQNRDSQLRYAGYMARLLCYALRVLQSEESVRLAAEGGAQASSHESEASDEDDSEDSDEGEDSDDDNNSSSRSRPVAIDVVKDARELFPWHANQRRVVLAFRTTLESESSDEARQDALLEFYSSIIFQKVRGELGVSIVLHFLAILGIDEEMNRLRQANDFSYMLAGVVYCVRALAVEKLLPSADRDQQGEVDDREFCKKRDEYLADGSFSVMSKMLSLLAYSKKLAMNHSNAGAVFWSKDRLSLQYKGDPIELGRFRDFVQSIVGKAEEQLWGLLAVTDREQWEVALHEIHDDVTFTKRGWSWMQSDENRLGDRREWLLRRALSSDSGFGLIRGGRLSHRAIRRYLRRVERFRELLLLCVHICGGQPARGTEITSLRFRNGFMQDRNIFVIDGQVVFVTRYHKSQSQFDKPKVIPRFLPARVGQLVIMYMLYVQALQEYLDVTGLKHDWTDYIWSDRGSPWETDRLTRILKRESALALGFEFTTHNYRHIAISIGREVVGPMFAKGYQEGMEEHAENDDEEQEGDGDALEMSAGRGGEMGTNRYGVPLDVIKHLSNRTVDTFRPLSVKWHRFLGFETESGLTRKRTAHGRGASVDEEVSTQQRERRAALSKQNDDRSRLRALGARWQQQQEQEGSRFIVDEDWDFGGLSSPLALRPSPSRAVSLPSSLQWSRPSATARTLFTSPEQAPVGEEQMSRAVQKALGRESVEFRSPAQHEALHAVVNGVARTPLVVVLPTGGGKSLLFMAAACLDRPGVTVVVVPYRALINELVQRAQGVGIDCIEWKHGQQNPAALVIVSADSVGDGAFLGYAQLLRVKGLLRRVFVDECHLTFTSSNWRQKLATVREVRKLGCPTIMLTATLPPILESELESSMAAHFARYIRALTTRVKTRYIVSTVKAGTLHEEVIRICHRMKKHLRLQKGIVYCRSREGCEQAARELRCAYYHAGAADNQERLEAWLTHGGLIVATSALGTGVDFPGIVFVLHVDMPYGMIDFAQESGRAGRAGEDVDSVIVVEEGRVERMAARMRWIDDTVMGEFITTRGCRRRVLGQYLDGLEVECTGDLARCDRCGEGLTAMFRACAQAAREREAFEVQMNELADTQGCQDCFVRRAEGWWDHRFGDCPHAVEEVDEEPFRRAIRFEKETHSCFKCGVSQRLCRTGEDSAASCQWPFIASGILRRIPGAAGGSGVVRRCGFEGDFEDRGVYESWLGQMHRGRVWGEMFSNAMFVLKEFFLWREQREGEEDEAEEAGFTEEEESGEEEEDGDSEGLGISLGPGRDRQGSGLAGEDIRAAPGVVRGRVGQDRFRRARRIVEESGEVENEQVGTVGSGQLAQFIAKLKGWEGVCFVCLAAFERRSTGHQTAACPADEFLREMMRQGIEQVGEMDEPQCEQGRCWAGWVRCDIGRESRLCRWSRLVREVAIALLYVGRHRGVVQRWIEGDEIFVRQGGGLDALQRFFQREIEWKGGVRTNMMCDLVWRFG